MIFLSKNVCFIPKVWTYLPKLVAINVGPELSKSKGFQQILPLTILCESQEYILCVDTISNNN